MQQCGKLLKEKACLGHLENPNLNRHIKKEVTQDDLSVVVNAMDAKLLTVVLVPVAR